MSRKTDTYGPLGADQQANVRVPPAPGSESAGPAVTDYVVELRRSAEALHALYMRTSRQWDFYRALTSVTTDGAGAVTASLEALQQGWEAEVELIAISVGGASSAAVVQVYRGGVQESQLLDFSTALLGSSPSRQTAFYCPPLRLGNSEGLVVRITGAVASQQVYVRAEGRKRER